MALALLLLLLVVLFGGFGFIVHALWVIAVIALLVWIIGFLVRGAEHRWYRW